MKLRLWPRSLIGQLVIAVALMLFVAQAINFALLVRSQKQQTLARGGGMAVARIIDAIDQDRGDMIDNDRRDRRARRLGPQRVVVTDRPFVPPPRAVALPAQADYVADLLAEANIAPTSVTAWALPHRRDGPRGQVPRRSLLVVAHIGDRYFAVRGRIPATGDRLQGFLVWQTLSLYALLLVPIMFIAWRAAIPLRKLTRAVRITPAQRDMPPLDENGPSDVRDLIGAFNAYRARIDTMLSDKDRMLGAVGHDLRTPLASLRVRVEQVQDGALRDKMIASIDEMADMLQDILAVARSGAGTETRQPIKVAAMLSELASEYGERGLDVTVDQAGAATVQARPMLLRRALRNLVDNAVTYGHAARLSVAHDGDVARIIVSDDGPGIADDQIAALIKPFARGEGSRNRATGGSGLGLSIAHDVADSEGGSLTLSNRDGGGLDAVISLPTIDQA